MELFDPAELARIESEFARGISAGAIVEIFRPKGVRLSEATFRKYVQAGLLPRAGARGSGVPLPPSGQSDSTAPRASESSTPHPISSSVRSTGDLS